MNKELSTKKVFISYAWTSQEHVDYVEQLAKRLTANGVYVVLDQWDLKPGNDKYAFMETCVKDSTIDRVLMIIDKKYAQKADTREGGVGTESMIISKEVYEDVSNEKFIPIVTEFDDEGKPYLPIFLGARIYVNFGNSSLFEEEYEKLIRLINNIPVKSRPTLGAPPSYLIESTVNVFRTGALVSSVKNQLDKNSNSINRISSEFFTLFQDELWEFVMPEIRNAGGEKIETIINKLHEFQVLKRNFIDFISMVTSAEYRFEADYLISFFEKTHIYLRPRDLGVSQWYPGDYELFKIVFRELFIYCIGVCIKNLNYSLAGELLNGTYVFESEMRGVGREDRSFCGIISIPEIFNGDYNRRIAPVGKYCIDNLYKLTSDEFVTADIICHIVCFLLYPKKSYYKWYPDSNVHHGGFRSHSYIRFKFFEKLDSRRFYEKVRAIFNDMDLEDLKELLVEYKKNVDNRISYGVFNEIHHVHEFIPPEKLGVEK